MRTVSRWDVARDGDTVVIECEANGFLKQQIRKANAILLEIGKGRQPVELMQRTLEGRDAVPRNTVIARSRAVPNRSEIPGGRF